MQYLVQFNASELSATVETVTRHLTNAGAVVSSYIPDHTLLVLARPEKVQAIKEVAGTIDLDSQSAHMWTSGLCKHVQPPCMHNDHQSIADIMHSDSLLM